MSHTPTDFIPPARTWRARAAEAAVADLGRTDDPEARRTARRVIDRGLLAAGLAFATLATLGMLAGWTTTAELLSPPDVPVHAPAMLLALVTMPWLLLTLRSVVLVLLRRRGLPLLGRLVPSAFLHAIGRRRPVAAERSIVTACGRRVGQVFANGSGHRVAAAGTGVFWTMFAAAAVATLWLTTARVALGFGWESSWLSPQVGQSITELAAAPLTPLIGPEALQPVAAPPTAAADDDAALAARRRWIRFLTAGLAVYLLIPMALWTFANAAIGHWLAERWRPSGLPVTATTRRDGPTNAAIDAPVAGDVASSANDGVVATHLVRLERPTSAPSMPKSMARLIDLGDLDTTEAIGQAADATCERACQIVVVSWLPATPDRGVRRRLRELATRTTHPPRLVLDGGDHLRRREPSSTVTQRLADWRQLANDLDLPFIEIDLEHLGHASDRLLAAFLAGKPDSRDDDHDRSPRPLDPARLDAAFAAIGRRLDHDSDPLPSDTAHAAAVRAIIEEIGADRSGGDRVKTLTSRVAGWRDLDATRPAARLAALARGGVELLPDTVRAGAVWASLGGLLGASACIAAATLAPATLVALPGWIGSGAGIGGLLSLTRRRAGHTDDGHEDADQAPRLDDRVPALAAFAVLMWSQSGDELRTSRLLQAVLPDDALPTLEDAEAARLWLATVRAQVIDAMEVDG